MSSIWNVLFAIASLLLAYTTAFSVTSPDKELSTAFTIPCTGCGPDRSDQVFFFDFTASSSASPCGTANLSLNGIPLDLHADTRQGRQTGSASISSYDHELTVRWTLDCLRTDPQSSIESTDDAQLLTAVIDALDSSPVLSQVGFTLSFQSYREPTLLRLEPNPVTSAASFEEADNWRNPSSQLRLQPSDKSAAASPAYIEQELLEIRSLELEVEALQALIADKKKALSDLSEVPVIYTEIVPSDCNSVFCSVRDTLGRVRTAASVIYAEVRTHPIAQATLGFASSSLTDTPPKKNDAMVSIQIESSTMDAPRLPPSAHLNDGGSSNLPYINEKGEIKRPDEVESDSSFAEGRGFWASMIKFLLIVTGLALLFRFLHRRRGSLRKLRDNAARREERRTARAYSRSARRQRLHDWWHGHHRPGRGQPNNGTDEKRNLINQQESILEEAAQDEIRQLAIQEDIRRMRAVQNMGDELIRAEEGRSGYARSLTSSRRIPILPPYSFQPTHPSQTFGFTPMNIPSAVSTMHHTGSSHQDMPHTPLSRTSSLPDYRSEAGFSEPPSYRTYDTDHDTFTDTDDDSGSAYDSLASPRSRYGFDGPLAGSCHWTPANSVPYASPRPSMATERSFV